MLNEFSYNIALYGEPDLRAPWGWQLFGHHCAVNCLVVEGRMVVSPVFLGAEPDEIDAGPHAGLADVFADRIELGTALMAALPDEQRRRGDRLRADGRPGDAARPGAPRRRAAPRRRLPGQPGHPVRGRPRRRHARRRRSRRRSQIAESFVRLLPEGPRAARLREIEEHLDETWFSWIGGHAPGDVFYYRLQSPVLIAELDHHCGVFLDYDTPQPFHIHTVLRTPHGNDYGRAWVRQWQERNADAPENRQNGGGSTWSDRGLSFGGHSQHEGHRRARIPGGRLTRVTPLGVVTVRTPSGSHHVAPTAGVGLQPVVPAAQAAQVGAVGRPALGVRDDVVEVGPAGAVAAAGVPARAVAGAPESPLAGVGSYRSTGGGGPSPLRAGRRSPARGG